MSSSSPPFWVVSPSFSSEIISLDILPFPMGKPTHSFAFFLEFFNNVDAMQIRPSPVGRECFAPCRPVTASPPRLWGVGPSIFMYIKQKEDYITRGLFFALLSQFEIILSLRLNPSVVLFLSVIQFSFKSGLFPTNLNRLSPPIIEKEKPNIGNPSLFKKRTLPLMSTKG